MTHSRERFLVTGSEGCIGSWVVRLLVLSGRDVVACDVVPEPQRVRRLLEHELYDRFTFVSADLRVPSIVDEVVATHRITRIVHLAALQIPAVAEDPVAGAEVNVVGTLRVLEAARQSSTVRGLAYASSSVVFGGASGWGFPDVLYGALKVCNEESARFYARDYETPSIGLRPCVVYGPNRERGLSAAITHALKAAVLGEDYTIPFRGPVDLQYVEDVAAAFVAAALTEQEDAPVYDLHGDLVEVADVVSALELVAPAASGLISVGSDPVPGRVEFDDGPLRATVGAIPRTALVDGIRLTLEHFRREHDAGTLTVADFRRAAGLPGPTVR